MLDEPVFPIMAPPDFQPSEHRGLFSTHQGRGPCTGPAAPEPDAGHAAGFEHFMRG